MNKNHNKTQTFIDELVAAEGSKILSIEMLGSERGESDLSLSDIDFLIICKNKKEIAGVFKTAVLLQEKIFRVRTSFVNKFVQRFLLASTSYKGIHFIMLGKDEFDENFRPKSFRLRILTKLIGRNLFLYEIKKKHRLLYGQNIIGEITVDSPLFSEKAASFLFPAITLVVALPTIVFSQKTFRIWCFKAIKYHDIGLNAYTSIKGKEAFFNKTALKMADEFRYQPEQYSKSSLSLYMTAWRNILGNVPFLVSKK